MIAIQMMWSRSMRADFVEDFVTIFTPSRMRVNLMTCAVQSGLRFAGDILHTLSLTATSYRARYRSSWRDVQTLSSDDALCYALPGSS
jgi:hypothetical protein